MAAHAARARDAAATACSTSLESLRAAWPISRPVAGLMTGNVRPDRAPTSTPPIRLWPLMVRARRCGSVSAVKSCWVMLPFLSVRGAGHRRPALLDLDHPGAAAAHEAARVIGLGLVVPDRLARFGQRVDELAPCLAGKHLLR